MMISGRTEIKWSLQTPFKKKRKRERFLSAHICSRRTGTSFHAWTGLCGSPTTNTVSLNNTKLL